jgi:hypothetical protein
VALGLSCHACCRLREAARISQHAPASSAVAAILPTSLMTSDGGAGALGALGSLGGTTTAPPHTVRQPSSEPLIVRLVNRWLFAASPGSAVGSSRGSSAGRESAAAARSRAASEFSSAHVTPP